MKQHILRNESKAANAPDAYTVWLRLAACVVLAGLSVLMLTPNAAQAAQAATATAASATPTPPPASDAKVNVEGLNVRSGPGTNYPIIANAHDGDQLIVLGTNDTECGWLKVITPEYLIGWVSGAPRYVTRNQDCARIAKADIPSLPPHTGTFVLDSPRDGTGELRIQNQGSDDAVVVLASRDETPLSAVYLRSHESFTIRGIRDGLYTLFYTKGTDWKRDAARFANALYFRSDATYGFTTEYQSDGYLYTVWTITLDVTDGGTRAILLAAGEFPRLR